MPVHCDSGVAAGTGGAGCRRTGILHPDRHGAHTVLEGQDQGAAGHRLYLEKGAAVRGYPARLRS